MQQLQLVALSQRHLRCQFTAGEALTLKAGVPAEVILCRLGDGMSDSVRTAVTLTGDLPRQINIYVCIDANKRYKAVWWADLCRYNSVTGANGYRIGSWR